MVPSTYICAYICLYNRAQGGFRTCCSFFSQDFKEGTERKIRVQIFSFTTNKSLKPFWDFLLLCLILVERQFLNKC